MALIDFTGFDSILDDDPLGAGFFSSFTYTVDYFSFTTDTRFGTGRALLKTSSYGNLYKAIPQTSTVIVGFAFKRFPPDSPASAFLSFGNADDTEQFTVAFRGDGSVQHLRGAYNQEILLAETSSVCNTLTWNYFEVKITFSNTVGSVESRVNGVTVLNQSGINTLFTGTNGYCTLLYLIPGDDTAIDDFYILDDTGATNNDFLGDIRVDSLVTTANGNQNDGVASAGSNYECVDDAVPNDDTDYVTLDAVNEIELYAMEDLPSTSYTKTINGLKSSIRLKKDSAGYRVIKPVFRINGVNYEHDDPYYLSTEYNYPNPALIWEVNPDDSNAWEEADVNALEAGIKVTA